MPLIVRVSDVGMSRSATRIAFWLLIDTPSSNGPVSLTYFLPLLIASAIFGHGAASVQVTLGIGAPCRAYATSEAGAQSPVGRHSSLSRHSMLARQLRQYSAIGSQTGENPLHARSSMFGKHCTQYMFWRSHSP